MLKNKYVKYGSALLLYIVLIFIANWSLILGTNLMKWDIWDAQLPNQIITSDALKAGQFPIWNPLYNYGTPNYAQVGTPVWYIISIVLNIIGYGATFPGLEYSLHLLIAAMGMFSLTYNSFSSNNKLSEKSRYAVAFSAGALYAFSGVFLSNAQHIMIIISAAWIPYVLLYTKKAVVLPKRKLFNIMMAGFLASFVLLGGYPEQFFDMFIVSFFWMLIINLLNNNDKLLVRIKNAVLLYISFAVCTALAASITLIPFLRLKNQITRGGGQVLVSYSFDSVLSAILPVSFDQISGNELSMGLFYVGFITIISIPIIFKTKKNSYLYLGGALIALFLSFGSNSFLYELFYRFIPMYSTFRFPTVWRAYWALFSILAVSDAWVEILEGNHIEKYAKITKVITCAGLLLAIFVRIEKYCATSDKVISDLSLICNALFLFVGIAFLHYCLSNCIKHKVFQKSISIIIFVALICMEVLAVAHKAMPVMIARREAVAYFQDEEYANSVSYDKDFYANRNTTSDFSGSVRSTSGIISNDMAVNKSFDEDGYVSVILSDIQNYKSSYNRSITRQNPEVFFTNDIVDSTQIELDNWLQSADVSPYQIHIDNKEIAEKCNKANIIKVPESEIVSEQYCDIVNYGNNSYNTKGEYITKSLTATKIRIYFEEIDEKMLLDTVFVKASDGSEESYSGNYNTITDGYGKKYIELSLPKVNELYSEIRFITDRIISQVSVVELGRNVKDNNLKIDSFGYNNVSASVNAPSDGIAVLMQSYYDGWKAYVDGEEVDIEEVDGCFIGIPVDEGNHRIELEFDPWDFKLGAGISLLYVIVFFGVIVYTIKKKGWD